MVNLIGKAYAISASDITPIINPITGVSDLKSMAANIVIMILWVVGFLAVIYLIYGGVLYITAGGDAEKATKGRTALINAVIGIVIVLLALVIVGYVQTIVR